MAIEKDLRLGTIQSGLRRSYKKLKVDASKQESDKDFSIKVFDVNASICELLFWVNANDEWQCINNKVEYGIYRKKGQPGANSMLGLKHAYNASKHEMSYVHLFTFEKKNSFMGSPKLLIADPASEPVWVNCPDDPKRDGQVKNYREFLKDRKVIQTFEEAITLLNMMNQKVQFKEK
ncbi:hypothetical protein CSV75_14780 [Sporosarcina sp. P18a]|uniref:hypothetical protein n=1 Tax=Sporosarcina sp. P18a TaxID=2048259 RepID=UPI000C17339B|nr:hypothetical protein [Sporosarcina sp. P18a]PIC78749.1 hypothetical protein CSV75_14780 [Sporosarcina sp. P18a]